jgi:hypothetical protein
VEPQVTHPRTHSWYVTQPQAFLLLLFSTVYLFMIRRYNRLVLLTAGNTLCKVCLVTCHAGTEGDYTYSPGRTQPWR